MDKIRPTISIGIPAHNEAGNISGLIKSLLKQKGYFKLEKIFVVCDGCTDDTEAKAKEIAKKHPAIVTVINDSKRLGKASRLNQIYKLNSSDFLATFDGDIMPAGNREIQAMLKVMTSNKNSLVVSGHMVTVAPKKGVASKILQVNHKLWDLTARIYNNGNNIHTSYGQAYLMRKDFSKKLKLPNSATCDQGFVFFSAQPSGYYVAHKSVFLINPAQSFKEAKINFGRTINERDDLVREFGPEVINSYYVPLAPRILAIFKIFFKTPLYTLAAIIYNLWVRFSYTDDPGRLHGLWSIVKTSKGPVKT